MRHAKPVGAMILLAVLTAPAGSLAAAAEVAQAPAPSAQQAQAQPQQAPPQPAQSGDWVPVGQGRAPVQGQSPLRGAPLLIAAYAFVWVALLVYVWSIWRRLRKVEGEVKVLSSRLADRARK